MDARDVGASTVVEVRALSKRYGAEGRKHDGSVTQALDRVSFAVACGEFTGIMGPSGSGKSTLLNCLATIDKPSSGTIVVGGRDVTALAGKELAKFRREDLGFIFQDSNLLDTLTAYENIALALTIQKAPVREIDPRVREAARTLGIEDVLQKYPYQMSGGQKQRVAAARILCWPTSPPARSIRNRRASCSNRLRTSTSGDPPSSWSRTTRSRPATATASCSSRMAACTASCAVTARSVRRSTAASWTWSPAWAARARTMPRTR